MQGHSSDDGDSFLNLNLSRDRADSIKRTLIDSGIDPDRIEIKALGEEEPIFDNKSFNGRGFNRCVLITIFWLIYSIPEATNKKLSLNIKQIAKVFPSK